MILITLNAGRITQNAVLDEVAALQKIVSCLCFGNSDGIFMLYINARGEGSDLPARSPHEQAGLYIVVLKAKSQHLLINR